jgi:hypothetical protein
MKIPVVLTTIDVHVDTVGQLTVTVNGEPYADDRVLGRDDLRSVVREIATSVATAVRVKIHESDGTTYDDYAMPPESPGPVTDEPQLPSRTPALAGAGFQPGEEVALAYVVVRQNADAEGNASLNLPPALLAATRGGLVLLGMTSRTVTQLVEAPV